MPNYVRSPTGVFRKTGISRRRLLGSTSRSFVYTFDDAKAPTRHSVQYFEIVGNRAIYKDGWMASTTPLRLPWVTIGFEPNPDDFKWELYNINDDFSQANNLADRFPDKLKELQDAFDVEARKYNVYPLDFELRVARRSGDSAKPHAGPQRVHILSGDGPHPRRIGAGLQKQVLDGGRRGNHP